MGNCSSMNVGIDFKIVKRLSGSLITTKDTYDLFQEVPISSTMVYNNYQAI
jgi:hypothetical protein